ncbi:hypothetical protein K2Z84_26415 [Candidatus Binatia bacterium]|nr:hypothetical protein [Candidatus Binatia bacterium]
MLTLSSSPARFLRQKGTTMLRLMIAGLLLAASSASAQTSPVTISPDGQFAIVQKDLGAERWAIVQDRNNRTITGNVFSPAGGPAQFVWCDSIGNSNYRCSGSSGCAQQPCQWASIATVTLPDSFFAVPGQPTPQPTPPPTSSLSGLLGTWEFTFKIITTFTFEYRLQQLGTSTSGYPAIVGVNELGDRIVVARVQDIDPGNGLPYEYALAEKAAGTCQFYVFNQTSTDRVAGLHTAAFQLSNGDCDDFLGEDDMAGIRTSRSASAQTAQTAGVKNARKARSRAVRSEARVSGERADAALGDLFRRLQQ